MYAVCSLNAWGWTVQRLATTCAYGSPLPHQLTKQRILRCILFHIFSAFSGTLPHMRRYRQHTNSKNTRCWRLPYNHNLLRMSAASKKLQICNRSYSQRTNAKPHSGRTSLFHRCHPSSSPRRNLRLTPKAGMSRWAVGKARLTEIMACWVHSLSVYGSPY